MTAQFFVVFEIDVFCDFFKIFRNLNLIVFQNLKFPTLLSGYSKELQILPHATAKRDCSNAFSFRGVTFFDFEFLTL